ncbi:DUF1002 domain-containing protein [Alkaliphilus oremlandii]|uniref:DUF1002 domain-containing protein n=1 Tax=Alkaliphilus oremlandii (strain OhILAs) TaxID=350688 RepID=A8MLB4_ALKOO|nr:DUF1002 domain-containing protein [Alkaliphilus oremlandii]ABW18028.1 protein of unknown function DUF1002 [Alkaliphilus oremlandii OhILAs]
MKNKGLIQCITILVIFISIFNIVAYADNTVVVTLGKNLNESQRNQILDLFNVSEGAVTIIEVNNQEERAYLEGIATEAQLGKITMSSAYVEILEEGSGIQVETYNISWVTKEMYQSALVTAGVKDAKVIAAAPFPVSGTGALTGILKAFEKATGKKISEEQKKVANEEVFQTGRLGEQIGQEKAAELIKVVKEEVIEKRLKNNEEIKKVVVDMAGRLDINLNMEQIEEISKLMEKINKLNLNMKEVRQQLKGIGEKIDQTIKDNEEVKSLLQKIIEMIGNLFRSLFGKFTNK